MSYVHLTVKSSNVKTGKIPVSTTACETCPDTCPLKGACKPPKVSEHVASRNRGAIAFANEQGFTVNLSADTLADADRLTALNIGPVVTLLPESQTVNTKTPAGRKVVVCPAAVRDGISCETCGLCARAGRDYVIGFPVHGTSKKKAATVAETGESGGGCYAKSGPLALHWSKVSDGSRGTDWRTFCESIASLPEGQLWRHNQAGDLPGMNLEIDRIMLADLVDANKGRNGFTYTHKPVIAG